MARRKRGRRKTVRDVGKRGHYVRIYNPKTGVTMLARKLKSGRYRFVRKVKG